MNTRKIRDPKSCMVLILIIFFSSFHLPSLAQESQECKRRVGDSQCDDLLNWKCDTANAVRSKECLEKIQFYTKCCIARRKDAISARKISILDTLTEKGTVLSSALETELAHDATTLRKIEAINEKYASWFSYTEKKYHNLFLEFNREYKPNEHYYTEKITEISNQANAIAISPTDQSHIQLAELKRQSVTLLSENAKEHSSINVKLKEVRRLAVTYFFNYEREMEVYDTFAREKGISYLKFSESEIVSSLENMDQYASERSLNIEKAYLQLNQNLKLQIQSVIGYLTEQEVEEIEIQKAMSNSRNYFKGRMQYFISQYRDTPITANFGITLLSPLETAINNFVNYASPCFDLSAFLQWMGAGCDLAKKYYSTAVDDREYLGPMGLDTLATIEAITSGQYQSQIDSIRYLIENGKLSTAVLLHDDLVRRVDEEVVL